jgi:hypothetical protein
MHKTLNREIHAQKRKWPSMPPLVDKPIPFLRPACATMAAAFVFCANPIQPTTNKPLPEDVPGLPIIYDIRTSVSGMTIDLAMVQLDRTDSTKTFYYRAYYGDGAADSGSFAVESGTIGILSHTYSNPGRYGISALLCKNPAFIGSNPRSDTVLVQ